MKNRGPAPVRRDVTGNPLSSPRARVLERLQLYAGPVTVAALADELGMHTNTARDHLEALVDRGLATRERAPAAGRGRPAWRYTAAEDHPEPDPRVRDYAGLASALASHIARTSSDPSADALAAGQEWGRSLAREAQAREARAGKARAGEAPGRRSLTNAAARRQVVEILGTLGFDPFPDSRATTVGLRRCPLLDTARRFPDVVCSVHLGIVRGALSELGGEPERTALLPFAEPDACRLHLRTGRTDG